MAKSESIGAHVDPGLKRVVRQLAAEHGQNAAEFVRDALSAYVRGYLELDAVRRRRLVARADERGAD